MSDRGIAGETRAGIGYDSHRFTDERPLVLGGVEIQDAAGLAGHSDADVLTHAVVDALLGAASLGDLGAHFPDDDERWRGAASTELAGRVVDLLAASDWDIVNVDVTVVMDKPHLGRYRDAIRTSLATTLRLGTECVSVKATTNEGMGFIGRGEGAAALAVAVIRRG